MLQPLGSQRVKPDLVTEQQQQLAFLGLQFADDGVKMKAWGRSGVYMAASL